MLAAMHLILQTDFSVTLEMAVEAQAVEADKINGEFPRNPFIGGSWLETHKSRPSRLQARCCKEDAYFRVIASSSSRLAESKWWRGKVSAGPFGPLSCYKCTMLAEQF